MANFGRRLKAIRRELGLSQESLAERVGVSKQSVNGWERGRMFPDLNRFEVICALAKKPYFWFFLPDGSDVDDPQRGAAIAGLQEAIEALERIKQRLEPKNGRDHGFS